MEYIDWRKSSEKIKVGKKISDEEIRMRNKRHRDYVEEQIREAQERGDFSNLPGAGKPLNLDDETLAGDKAMGYHILKSNGLAPAEIELAKEIRQERERAEAKLKKLRHQGKILRARRVPPFDSEKRIYNNAVEKAAREYESTLRELNRKILTLNLVAPPAMHQPMLEVELLVEQFRISCPLL